MYKAQLKTVDEYISAFPKDMQYKLQTIRQTVKEMVPEAGEKISYGIPTITLNGRYLVYFAGFKNHIGFYPAPVAIEAFARDLAPYKQGKGSVQFPLDKPLPLPLIRKIVKYRVQERLQSKGKYKARPSVTP